MYIKLPDHQMYALTDYIVYGAQCLNKKNADIRVSKIRIHKEPWLMVCNYVRN